MPIVEQADSSCNNAEFFSIDQATIPVALGMCPAWSGPPVALNMQSLQYRASGYTSSIENMSSVELAGSGCYTCSVSSIEQTTIPVTLGMNPAWSGLAVVVIYVALPVNIM